PEPGDAEPVDVTFDMSMGDHFFEPSELEVEAGQTFRINLTNAGEFIHNLRIAGADGEYETGDDLVSTPKFQTGGETGELVGQIDKPGVYSFRSDSQSTEMTGTITVK
ncbi:MAG: cupredoxin domain-containing protein, partial [Chloroflexi bacterium]|nr:cupredoxin domain-containing protein [Chloroflexota bacterium]